MNIKKQHKKLAKVNVLAFECLTRQQAQKLIKKAAKIHKKLKSIRS
tara:strand:+ start:788 stop:925 length:138 start_codon:yes stop_codon:yes gene_type:complete